jgi:hypothetical protein
MMAVRFDRINRQPLWGQVTEDGTVTLKNKVIANVKPSSESFGFHVLQSIDPYRTGDIWSVSIIDPKPKGETNA